MVQRRYGARLAVETRPQLRIGGERRRQHLDRDDPIEPCVAGTVDLAHAPSAHQRDNLIRAEPDAGLELHESAGLYARKREKGAPLTEARPQSVILNS
jgi:hypothetical protein